MFGRSADAQRHYEQARKLSEALFDAAPGDLAVADVLYETHMGLGHLKLDAHKHGEAKAEFTRAASISEAITNVNPAHDAGRRGLIEAYLQIGRSQSFAGELAAAETSFRKMHAMATRWVEQEPGNHTALDLVASACRKLADCEKFAKQYADSQQHYLSAIAIGRELVAAEPQNLEFKLHLSIALDDLAGIVRDQRQFAAARPLFHEAETLFSELAESDPDRLEIRLRLLHTRLHEASLEREAHEFPAAAGFLRQAREQLLSLEREGRLERGRVEFTSSEALKEEIAFCEAVPRALADLTYVRSEPIARAARLLLLRARTAAGRNDRRQFAATVQALEELSSDQSEELYEVARCCCRVAADLDAASLPDLPTKQRLALRNECAGRACDLLKRAIDAGFRDLNRLKSDELSAIAKEPKFQSLVERVTRAATNPR